MAKVGEPLRSAANPKPARITGADDLTSDVSTSFLLPPVDKFSETITCERVETHHKQIPAWLRVCLRSTRRLS